jgi:chemotaxis protein CheX
MDAKLINPFVEGATHVFSTMLDTSIERLAARMSTTATAKNGQALTSIIGISGKASGVVALAFPHETAIGLTQRFLGTEFSDVTPEVTDAISELANMIGGFAKAKFDFDPPLELSLPTVVNGTDYKLNYPTRSAWIEIPFGSDAGAFTMDVSFSKD